jgi:hypothetical protein
MRLFEADSPLVSTTHPTKNTHPPIHVPDDPSAAPLAPAAQPCTSATSVHLGEVPAAHNYYDYYYVTMLFYYYCNFVFLWYYYGHSKVLEVFISQTSLVCNPSLLGTPQVQNHPSWEPPLSKSG